MRFVDDATGDDAPRSVAEAAAAPRPAGDGAPSDDTPQWVETLYGDTTLEWRMLVALDSRSEAAAAPLPEKVESQDLVYGEFAVADGLEVVDKALALAGGRPGRLVDVGSGCGRLVLALARRHRDREVVGVEIQPRLHAIAESARDASGLPNARLVCEDLHASSAFDGAAVAFCYSTALHDDDDDLAADLSDALARGLEAGSIAVTTDRRLRACDFDLV